MRSSLQTHYKGSGEGRRQATVEAWQLCLRGLQVAASPRKRPLPVALAALISGSDTMRNSE